MASQATGPAFTPWGHLMNSASHINNSVNEQHWALNSVAASPQARLPLDQDTDSEEPRSSVLSGWLVLGVASQLSIDDPVSLLHLRGIFTFCALLNLKHLPCITTATSTTSFTNSTWSFSTVFWIFWMIGTVSA